MEVYEVCEVAFERGSVGYLFLYNALISSSYLENKLNINSGGQP